MSELTQEQVAALDAQRDQPCRLVHPRTGETFVLVRQDVYERLRRFVADVNEQADWDDPAFDVYDQDEP